MLGNDKQHQAFLLFFTSGTELHYQKGEYIIRPGESPSHIFYVKKGLVKAFNISKYGEDNLLIIRKHDQVFPLISAITGEERDIIYQALVPTTVYRVDKEKFRDYVEKNTESVYPLLDLITEQYHMHSERILNLEYRSVRERLISFLLTMAKHFGKKTSDGLVIDVPLRHQDIASSINSSRETTSRELGGLERKNLVSNKQSIITIYDLEKLKKLL